MLFGRLIELAKIGVSWMEEHNLIPDEKGQIGSLIMSVVGFAIALILISSVVIGSAFPTMIDAIAGLDRTNMTGATAAIVDLLPLITAVVILIALLSGFLLRER